VSWRVCTQGMADIVTLAAIAALFGLVRLIALGLEKL
jgi:hypothetical protein